MRWPAWWMALVTLPLLSAGCAEEGAPPAGPVTEPCVVTGPMDTSCETTTAALDPSARQHLHD